MAGKSNKAVLKQKIELCRKEKPEAQGIAFIVGMFGPAGTDLDVDHMEATFRSDLNFAVYREKNLTNQELISLVEAAADSNYPDNYKFVAFYYAGHGGVDESGNAFVIPMEVEKDKSGSEYVRIEEHIITPLITHRKAGKFGRAYLFFFDCCLSSAPVGGSQPNFKVTANKAPESLVAYATSTFSKARGDSKQGGLWTRYLNQYLKQDMLLTTALAKTHDAIKDVQSSHREVEIGEVNLKASAIVQKVYILNKRPSPDDVFTHLKAKSSQWDPIARELKIDYDFRTGLRRRMDLTDEARLEEVIQKWYEHETRPPISWKGILDMLKRMRLMDVARKVNVYLENPDTIEAYRDEEDYQD